MFPLKFRGQVNREETRVVGLSSSEDRMIVAGVILAWYQRVTDGRSDGRTVRQTESIIANTALCELRWRAVKIGNFSLNAVLFTRYLEMCDCSLHNISLLLQKLLTAF